VRIGVLPWAAPFRIGTGSCPFAPSKLFIGLGLPDYPICPERLLLTMSFDNVNNLSPRETAQTGRGCLRGKTPGGSEIFALQLLKAKLLLGNQIVWRTARALDLAALAYTPLPRPSPGQETGACRRSRETLAQTKGGGKLAPKSGASAGVVLGLERRTSGSKNLVIS
jgi:hypothetical protein